MEIKSYLVLEIIQETPNVKTFRLKPETGKVFDFKPGQFINLHVGGEFRAFSIASSPNQENYIELTIKTGGKFTHKLDALKIGDKVGVSGPHGGVLNIADAPEKDLVLIAGGTGISPLMSGIRFITEENLPKKMVLFYTNKTLKDIKFYKELQDFEKQGKIKVVYSLTEETPKGWKGETKRIDKQMIAKHVKDLKGKAFFLCGPPVMVKELTAGLQELGVSKDKIKTEAWQ